MKMERKWSFLVCFLLLGTLVECRRLEDSDIKPDCDCPTDPSHHHGSHASPLPSHGVAPSHGSSGTKPAPSTPSIPSDPSHGSGGYYPSPSSQHSPPSTPTPIVLPPVTPTPTTPSSPIPIVVPPVTPTPTTPSVPTPTTPSVPTPYVPTRPIPDPSSVPPFAPGTCSYWITHPDAIWAIFGYWGTIGHFFGAACSSAFGKNISLQDALKNMRTDGIGALYREGTAALLNSMACKNFSFTTQQVKDAFAAAAVSDKAAAAQAEMFKQANGGGVKH